MTTPKNARTAALEALIDAHAIELAKSSLASASSRLSCAIDPTAGTGTR